MSDTDKDDNNDIVLAGEYALRLLDPEAEAAFEERLRAEPALRALVSTWDEDLISLTDSVDPVAPPRGLKFELENRLFATQKAGKRRSSFWGFFGSVAVAAAVLAIVLVAQPGWFRTDDGPVYIAQMNGEGSDVIVTARLDMERNSLQLQRVAGQAQPGRAFELWLIADGAEAPISLGVLPTDTDIALSIPSNLVASFVGGTLAISDEPEGGSPTGQPTGAILAAGAITLL